MTISVAYDLNATYADRIEWWECEKQNCEDQLRIAQEHHDSSSAKNWKKEAEFCKKQIKELGKLQDQEDSIIWGQ